MKRFALSNFGILINDATQKRIDIQTATACYEEFASFVFAETGLSMDKSVLEKVMNALFYTQTEFSVLRIKLKVLKKKSGNYSLSGKSD